MNNLNNLEAIWKTAATDTLPSSAQMLQLVKQFRDQKLRNKVFMIIISVGAIVLFIISWLFIQPKLISTTIGIALTTVACVILAFTNIRSIKRFIHFKDSTNKEFIAFMEQTRVNQLYYHQKTQPLGMALCSAGLILYLYEFVRESLITTLIFYAVAVILLAYLWLYMRPVKFKKQSAQLNETIEKLRKLSNQIT